MLTRYIRNVMRMRIIGLDVGRTKIYKQDTINRIINIDPLSEYGRIATVSEIDHQELSPLVFYLFFSGLMVFGGKGKREKVKEREREREM